MTNWVDANTTEPAIAAGSFIEVNSGYVEFATETAIADEAGVAVGTVYVYVDVTGGSVAAKFSNDAPVWNPELNGLYASADNNIRYTGHVMQWDGSAAYTLKKTIIDKEVLQFQYVGESN